MFEVFRDNFVELYGGYLSEILFSLCANCVGSIIILAAYMILDRKNGEKRSAGSYIAIFIFGGLYILYDAGKAIRSKENTVKKSLVIIMCVYIIATAVNIYACNVYESYKELSADDESEITAVIYFDRYGNAYDEFTDVVYYTADGAQFCCDGSENFVCKSNTPDEKYDEEYWVAVTYLDRDGYLVFTEDILDSYDSDDTYIFYDENADAYYANARYARWDLVGNMYWVFEATAD